MYTGQECATDPSILQNLPDNASWHFETDEEREWRWALADFFESVKPVVQTLMDGHLTKRQQEAVHLYFVCGLSQEEVADRMELSQSTVSRHIFGTHRNHKTVGGAIPKLRKLCCTETAPPAVVEALTKLARHRTPRGAAALAK